jgi:membrane associated rhomboid family serine protease
VIYGRDALRALSRLDDRVLGRLLDRRPPLRLAIVFTVIIITIAVPLTVITGNAAFLGGALIGLASGWIMRILLRPRR